MRAQIIAILFAAVFCSEATYLPGGFGLGGSSYGGLGLGYTSSPVMNVISPYSSYASGGLYNNAGPMKMAYIMSPELGNSVVDVAGSPGAALRYGYGSSLGSYGNIAYVVKK